MNSLLSIFITWQFLFFCLGIAAITYIVRNVLEYFILDQPQKYNSKFWRSLFLPLFPVFLGWGAGTFIKHYPYPDGIAQNEFGRIAFGLVGGLLSTVVYRVIVAILRNETQAVINTVGQVTNTSLIDIRNSINTNNTVVSSPPTNSPTVINTNNVGNSPTPIIINTNNS